MKPTPLVIAGLVLCCMVLLASRSSADRPAGKTAWEYAIRELPAKKDQFLEQLNKLGEEGWELVTVGPLGTDVILKRAK